MSELILLLTYSAPVGLAAVGETVVEKSGVMNIGIEGAMLLSAFVSMMICSLTQNPWLGLAAGATVGVAAALLFGVFTVVLSADQVVVGTAINLLALGVTGTVFRSMYGQSGKLVSVPRLPSWHGVDALLVFLLLSLPAMSALINRTQWGLAVRSVGEYPKATEGAGLSVNGLRMQALLLGGFFAGLAGVYLSLCITGTFAENMTAGRGFVAIAMVTFGRWKAPLAFASALLIGLAESFQFRIQSYGWNVPYQLMIALPYVVALAVLVIVGKGAAAPSALGQPYRKES